MASGIAADLDRFYAIHEQLASHIGGARRLADCDASAGWPARGVYFFFEPGEVRSGGEQPRVVRVGTHAVSEGSSTTLWTRLKQHRGRGKPGEPPGGGNHRGSIFRRHVGMALLRSGQHPALSVASWGIGGSAPADVVAREEVLERVVSEYIGRMPFLWIEADDEPSASSIRSYVERNSIGLLSAAVAIDPPSPEWLGWNAADERIRTSGLWNVNYVGDSYDPAFLDALEHLVTRMARGNTTGATPVLKSTEPLARPVLALVSCAKRKEQYLCPAAELYARSLAFRMAFGLAGRIADATLILSAKHGAVRAHEVLQPYNETLIGAPHAARERWATMTHSQLRSCAEYQQAKTVVWLAGEAYRSELLPLVHADGKICIVPMKGLRQGQQRAWLKARIANHVLPLGRAEMERPTPPRRRVEAQSSPRDRPPTSDDFRRALHELKAKAAKSGERVLEISAGELHRLVGGYPGTGHRMPACCSVMRQEMLPGDRIVAQPPKGAGANLRIAYTAL
jgi:hypothetical protein